MMYVIAHHQITDIERFRRWSEEPVAGRPLHWRMIVSAPNRAGTLCFSIWRVDSAEALQRFLERSLGDAAIPVCHEVDEDNAMGLHQSAATPVWHLQRDLGVARKT